MWVHSLLLLVGMGLLVVGADWFVGGASRIAKALKVPPLVVGLTLVSMGTSAPEASVSLQGAIGGLQDIAVGNVVGSNVFNTLLILGLSALIAPLAIGRDMRRYDIPIMVALYGALLLFAFGITPLILDRVESVVLLTLFVGYTAFLIVRAVRQRQKASEPLVAQPEKRRPIWLSILMTVAGLAGVIFGGDLVVDNAASLAKAFGMSEALVGLTIVAVGTSLPELVTSIVASVKKENDIAVGNVVGSNIFNVVFILGLSSTICPLTLDFSTLVDMLVMLGAGLIILAVGLFSEKLHRPTGAALVLLYIGYLTFIIIRN